jgi:primosomal protein N' (replication factor Y)
LGPPLRQKGAGTERVEETFRALFQGVETVRLDSDTVRQGELPEDVLARFAAGSARVLVGTQMIAKGLDIPDVTLVGVVSADTAFSLPDFRATERTFQLLAQVAGRAGRREKPGRTVIQTFAPDHPAIALAARHDYESFAKAELEARRALFYPPYARLLRILFRGEKEERVRAEAERLTLELRAAFDALASILGPAASPRAYLVNRFRWQAMLKARTVSVVRAALALVERWKPASGVEVTVDVDPYSVL